MMNIGTPRTFTHKKVRLAGPRSQHSVELYLPDLHVRFGADERSIFLSLERTMREWFLETPPKVRPTRSIDIECSISSSLPTPPQQGLRKGEGDLRYWTLEGPFTTSPVIFLADGLCSARLDFYSERTRVRLQVHSKYLHTDKSHVQNLLAGALSICLPHAGLFPVKAGIALREGDDRRQLLFVGTSEQRRSVLSCLSSLGWKVPARELFFLREVQGRTRICGAGSTDEMARPRGIVFLNDRAARSQRSKSRLAQGAAQDEAPLRDSFVQLLGTTPTPEFVLDESLVRLRNRLLKGLVEEAHAVNVRWHPTDPAYVVRCAFNKLNFLGFRGWELRSPRRILRGPVLITRRS